MNQKQTTRNVMIENSELYCHVCNKYVQFQLNFQMNGQHVIKCPNCGHEHYRYINDGKISDRRWGSSNALFTDSHQAQVRGFTSSSTSSVSGTLSWTYGSYGVSASS